MGRRFQQTFFPEKTHRWQTGTCRGAPHWLLREKCKPKLQWGFIPNQSEWPPSKSIQIINVGEDVENRKLLYSFFENVKWDSHYVKQHKGSLKKQNCNYHMIQHFSSWAHFGKTYTHTHTQILIWKHTCTTTSIAALLKTAKIRKAPKCPIQKKG